MSLQRNSSTGVDTEARDTLSLLRETLRYARERDYTGWDLYDGESSALLQRLPIDNKYLNLTVQQVIRRCPVNLRPHFRVEQRRSFMGAALFALANLTAADVTGDTAYESEAETLVEWLVENQSDGYAGFCGGHKHPMQELEARVLPNDPDIVSTAWAARTLVAAADQLDPAYADHARSAADFVVTDLDYTTTDQGATIKYKPTDTGDSVTINANAMGARLFVDLYDHFGDTAYRERATAILDHVASLQTDLGGWTYRDPPSASHLSMDNFHNGFIIDCFRWYQTVTGDDRYDAVLDQAVQFYRDILFDSDGAPNHDESSAYPKDIHDVAQGIIVFTRLGDRDTAGRILDWGLENLYGGDGAFYHQQRRFFTDTITYMRWCEAWMAYALSVSTSPMAR